MMFPYDDGKSESGTRVTSEQLVESDSEIQTESAKTATEYKLTFTKKNKDEVTGFETRLRKLEEFQTQLSKCNTRECHTTALSNQVVINQDTKGQEFKREIEELIREKKKEFDAVRQENEKDIDRIRQENKNEIDKLKQKVLDTNSLKMVQLTSVCALIVGVFGGFGLNHWYIQKNFVVDPAIARFYMQIKGFCDSKGINETFECFKTISNSDGEHDDKFKSGVNNLITLCEKHGQSMNDCLLNLGKLSVKEEDNSVIASLKSEHDHLKDNFGKTVAKLQEVNHTVNELKIELGTCKANLSEQKTQSEDIKQKVKHLETDQTVTRDQQEYTSHTTVPLNLFVIVSLILGVGEFCIIVLFCNKARMYTADQAPVIDNKQQNGTPTAGKLKRPLSVLDEIRRSTVLDDAVCIVSFNDSTQSKHCKMVNSYIDPNIHKTSFLVSRHEDLKHLPPSKICFVFVDYNARNIILESEQELGDIRKTTVKAVQRIGGEVILVYCGDEYAMVKNNELYNPGLSSVKHHPELKQLEAKLCVLTVHQDKGFIDYQKRHLKVLTTKLLKH